MGMFVCVYVIRPFWSGHRPPQLLYVRVACVSDVGGGNEEDEEGMVNDGKRDSAKISGRLPSHVMIKPGRFSS